MQLVRAGFQNSTSGLGCQGSKFTDKGDSGYSINDRLPAGMLLLLVAKMTCDCLRCQQVGLNPYHSLTDKYAWSRSMRSANLYSSRPRDEASIVRHSEPSSNAARAALTALSTSACSSSTIKTFRHLPKRVGCLYGL
jgi:hypothetical protein